MYVYISTTTTTTTIHIVHANKSKRTKPNKEINRNKKGRLTCHIKRKGGDSADDVYEKCNVNIFQENWQDYDLSYWKLYSNNTCMYVCMYLL